MTTNYQNDRTSLGGGLNAAGAGGIASHQQTPNAQRNDHREPHTENSSHKAPSAEPVVEKKLASMLVFVNNSLNKNHKMNSREEVQLRKELNKELFVVRDKLGNVISSEESSP